MADIFSKSKRSEIMSRIRGKDTGPELVVRRELFARGFRYRLHAKDLPGKPDIVLPKYGAVVIVDGCFWHGHRNGKVSVCQRPAGFFGNPKSKTIAFEMKKQTDAHEIAMESRENLGVSITF